ncbi:MAG: exodeoxyribonuclease III [Olegusella sp.]|nr:exodeoxyribonuclease III [Olegusella sp.]
MAMKKLPPAEKAYEAYSAIADGRVEMHEASGDGGTASGYALVDSSDRTKTYEVAWKGDTYSSTDNGTYWQGYAGYPVIAVLVLQGRLPQPPADTLADLAGVPWKQLNDAHKRDYAAAADEALAGKPHEQELRAAVDELNQALAGLDLTLKRGRVKHPRGAAEVGTEPDAGTTTGTEVSSAATTTAAPGTMRFISWNIDSLNAALTGTSPRSELTRDVLRTIAAQDADIIAIQETKLPATGMNKKQAAALADFFPGYDYAWVSSHEPARKGYAGTMALYKKGMDVTATYPAIGAPEPMDEEGRIVTLELPECFFTLVYTPNAGDGLRRLAERQVWDERFADYLAELDAKKPVITCGDFNVAHEEIDLANPAGNHQSAGFTDEERAGFTALLGRGFTDSFRHVHGDVEGVYSWWAQRVRTSKINNSGWRIDYFLVSDRIADRVVRSEMLDSGPRQDHTPLLLEIK